MGNCFHRRRPTTPDQPPTRSKSLEDFLENYRTTSSKPEENDFPGVKITTAKLVATARLHGYSVHQAQGQSSRTTRTKVHPAKMAAQAQLQTLGQQLVNQGKIKPIGDVLAYHAFTKDARSDPTLRKYFELYDQPKEVPGDNEGDPDVPNPEYVPTLNALSEDSKNAYELLVNATAEGGGSQAKKASAAAVNAMYERLTVATNGLDTKHIVVKTVREPLFGRCAIAIMRTLDDYFTSMKPEESIPEDAKTKLLRLLKNIAPGDTDTKSDIVAWMYELAMSYLSVFSMNKESTGGSAYAVPRDDLINQILDTLKSQALTTQGNANTNKMVELEKKLKELIGDPTGGTAEEERTWFSKVRRVTVKTTSGMKDRAAARSVDAKIYRINGNVDKYQAMKDHKCIACAKNNIKSEWVPKIGCKTCGKQRKAFSKERKRNAGNPRPGKRQESEGSTPCSFYAKGNCTRGEKCKFLHDARLAGKKGKRVAAILDSGTTTSSSFPHGNYLQPMLMYNPQTALPVQTQPANPFPGQPANPLTGQQQVVAAIQPQVQPPAQGGQQQAPLPDQVAAIRQTVHNIQQMTNLGLDNELTVGKNPSSKSVMKRLLKRARAATKKVVLKLFKRKGDRVKPHKNGLITDANTTFARVTALVKQVNSSTATEHSETVLTKEYLFLSDGGASVSVVDTPDKLINVRKSSPRALCVRDANDNAAFATHTGTLVLNTIKDGVSTILKIENVWVVPGMINVISETQLRKECGLTIIKPQNSPTFYTNEEQIKIILSEKDGLDYLRARLVISQSIEIGPKNEHTKTKVQVTAQVRFMSKDMRSKFRQTMVDPISEQEYQQLLDGAAQGNNLKHGFIPDSCYSGMRKYVLGIKYANNPTPYRVSTDSLNELMMLHTIWGHRSLEIVGKLCRDANIKFATKVARTFCDQCAEVKVKDTSAGTTKRHTTPKTLDPKAAEGFERLHCDLAGPYPPSLNDGYRWELQACDRNTRVKYWYGLRSPGEVYDVMEDLLLRIKTEHGKAPKSAVFMKSIVKNGDHHMAARNPSTGRVIYTDQMPSFKSTRFRQMAARHGCIVRHSPPYLQRMNGLIERSLAVTAEAAMCARASTNKDVRYWAFSHRYMTHQSLFCPTKGLDGFISPFEKMNGRPPQVEDFKHIRMFGAMCVPKQHIKAKLKPRGRSSCEYMGWNERINQHILYNPQTKKVIHTLSVSFNNDAPTCVAQPYGKPFPQKGALSGEVQPNLSFTEADLQKIVDSPATTEMHDKICEQLGQQTVPAYSDQQSAYENAAPPTHAGEKDAWRQHKGPPNATTPIPQLPSGSVMGGTHTGSGGTHSGNPTLVQNAPNQEHDTINVDTGEVYSSTDEQINMLLATGMSNARLYTVKDGTGDEHAYLVDVSAKAEDIEKVHTQHVCTAKESHTSWSSARKSIHAAAFDAARKEEVRQLSARGTFIAKRVDQMPLNTHYIPSSMGFVLKGDGRAKGRWVLGGHRMKRGVHVKETRASTPSSTNFKIHLALAAKNRAKVRSADIKGAFLFADRPPGEQYAFFPPKDQKDLAFDSEGNRLCYINLKCQYGHPAASRQWQQTMHSYLVKHGWERTAYSPLKDPAQQHEQTPDKKCGCECDCHDRSETTDENVYRRGNTRLLVYVDDLLYWSTDTTGKEIEQFEKELQSAWGDVRAGPCTMFLGVDVDQKKDYSIEISMRSYIQTMSENLKQYHKPLGKTQPLPTNWVADRSQCPEPGQELDTKRYPMRSVVGSLVYCLMARYDIQFAVGQVAKVMDNPSKEHWRAALHLLSYVEATAKTVGTTFAPGPHRVQVEEGTFEVHNPGTLIAFGDSSCSDTPAHLCACEDCTKKHGVPLAQNDSCTTTVSGCIMLSGGVIESYSKNGGRHAHSTSAELQAGAMCLRRVLLIRKHLQAMGEPQMEPTPIYCDNQATVTLCLSKLGVASNRSKHILAKHFLMRDHQGVSSDVRKIRTTLNRSDIGTKSTPGTTLRGHIDSFLRVGREPTRKRQRDQEDSNKGTTLPPHPYGITLPGQPLY